MRGKVTADAYSGGRRIGGRRFAVVACGEAARVGGFTWRDDDWEVTRPRVTTARLGLNKLVGGGFVELHCWARIILLGATESPLGAIVTRDTSHPSWGGEQCGGRRVGGGVRVGR
jgi:hypothetical protein